MNLHLRKDDFESLINICSRFFHIPTSAIRKDYFICLILKNLEQSLFIDQVVFKGGTSLSKCYPGSIERFSEDIDLTFMPGSDLNDKKIDKKLKELEQILVGYGCIEKINDERNSRNKSAYVWFNEEYKEDERIKLEIGSRIVPNPYQKRRFRSYVHEYLISINENEAIKEFELQDIYLNVLNIERTFVDKLMAVRRHAICNTLSNKVRHIYDVVMLMQVEEIKEFLEDEDNLKVIVTLTKENDRYYLEKRRESEIYNAVTSYDYPSWKEKLDSNIQKRYETLHQDLLYTDEKQDWVLVDVSFSQIDRILKKIGE